MKKFIYLLLVGVVLSSCYKEDELTPSEPEIFYNVAPSDDPLDQYIYGYYQDYSTYILYHYDTVDYNSGVVKSYKIEMTLQKEKEKLNAFPGYFETIFNQYYPDEFKKKYFPFKILIADSIMDVSKKKMQLKSFYAGDSYFAFGDINQEVYDENELQDRKTEVHPIFWTDYLYNQGIIQIPEAFFKESEGAYSERFDLSIDILSLGFFKPAYTSPWDYYAPNQISDVYQFIEFMTTLTEQEAIDSVAGYSKLKRKYEVLKDYTVNELGVDLHAISE